MAAESPSPHEAGDLLGQVLSHPDAQDAIESLRKDGFDLRDRTDWCTFLVGLYLRLYAEWTGQGKPSRYARSQIRNLHALPEKLRTLADELETRDWRFLTAYGVHHGLAPESLSGLPVQMREAAALIDAAIARGKVGPARKCRADLQYDMERTVTRRTRSGKPHREEICQLLRLACQLAGKGDVEIDPEEMKQASYRRRKGHLASRNTPRKAPSRNM